MRIKSLFITFLLILFLAFPLATFAGYYASLVGKRVEIHGPYRWDTLAVAQDKQTCDQLKAALDPRSKEIFVTLLNSFKVVRITKNTKALVLDIEVLEGRAQIIILTGIYRGVSGWVPLEWLRGNENRPSIKDSVPYHRSQYEVLG